MKNITIESGSQMNVPVFLDICIAEDKEQNETPILRISSSTILGRLTRIGYSIESCQLYFKTFFNVAFNKRHRYIFRNNQFQYYEVESSFWMRMCSINIQEIAEIWKRYICKSELRSFDDFILNLIRNDVEVDFFDPYFNPLVNYFTISSLVIPNDIFEYDFSNVIGAC